MALKLNKKKSKLMTTGRTTSFKIVNEDIKVVDSFCLLESATTIKEKKMARKCIAD